MKHLFFSMLLTLSHQAMSKLVAVDDSAQVEPGSKVEIPFLSNDEDDSGSKWIKEIVDGPSKGYGWVSGKDYVYNAPSGFNGKITIKYKATNSKGEVSNVGTMTVQVGKKIVESPTPELPEEDRVTPKTTRCEIDYDNDGIISIVDDALWEYSMDVDRSLQLEDKFYSRFSDSKKDPHFDIAYLTGTENLSVARKREIASKYEGCESIKLSSVISDRSNSMNAPLFLSAKLSKSVDYVQTVNEMLIDPNKKFHINTETGLNTAFRPFNVSGNYGKIKDTTNPQYRYEEGLYSYNDLSAMCENSAKELGLIGLLHFDYNYDGDARSKNVLQLNCGFVKLN